MHDLAGLHPERFQGFTSLSPGTLVALYRLHVARSKQAMERSLAMKALVEGLVEVLAPIVITFMISVIGSIVLYIIAYAGAL